MKKILIAALFAVLTLGSSVGCFADMDMKELIIIDHDGNVDLDEYISEELKKEKATEDAIDVFWDVTLKETATKEQIEDAFDKAAKVCYLPKRDEYFDLIEEAEKMLEAKKKAEAKEQGEARANVIQAIMMLYNSETDTLYEETTMDDILEILPLIENVTGEAKSEYIETVNRMLTLAG